MQEVTTSLAQRTHKLSLEDYTPPPSPTYTHAQSSGGGGGANKSSLSSTNTITSTSNAAPRSLALKISRLLSASLEDAGTRTALETLNEFGLDDSNNDNEGAGGVLGGGDRSTKSRRLRAEIDRRLLEDSSRFLEAFKEVNDKLSSLQSHLSSMHTVVDTVQSQLSTANSGTKHLLSSAASLRAERLAASDRQAIVTVFLKRYTLSDEEVNAMNGRDVPVGKEVFDAIRRTENIRRDCRILMSGEAVEEAKAGMEIMLLTSQYLDNAFAKLHKYTTFAARNYTTRTDVLDNVSPTLRYALELLKVNRSDLFEDTLNILSSTRSSAISSKFIEALTRGVDPVGGNKRSRNNSMAAAARPIELHAHDPIRYVGDILAWVHQAMASEREFLENLFGMKETGRIVGSARPPLPRTSSLPSTPALNQLPSDEERLRALLDKNLEGCGRPMKIRIQQTIKSQSLISSITTYQTFQLLQFYRILLKKTMGQEAMLYKILTDLSIFSNRAFFDTLEEQGRLLVDGSSTSSTVIGSSGLPNSSSIEKMTVDLKPPLSIRDALSSLKEIMQVYKHSYLDEEDRSELDDFEHVLQAALGPVLELVDIMKDTKSPQQEMEKLIFECNCTVFVQYTLEPFPDFTAKRTEMLDERLKKAVESLTSLHFINLFKETGLEPILSSLRSKSDEEQIATTTNTSSLKSRSLNSAIRSFDIFLTHIDTLSSPRLSLLSSHRLANEIHREALHRIVAAYNEIWSAIMDEQGKEDKAEGSLKSTLLHRSREEVGMLLGA